MGQTQGAVGQVRVISTGKAAGHPEHIYGTKKSTLWWILTSKKWVELPLNVFVIEHVTANYTEPHRTTPNTLARAS